MTVYVKINPQEIGEFVQKVEEIVEELNKKGDIIEHNRALYFNDVTMSKDEWEEIKNRIGINKYLVDVATSKNDIIERYVCGNMEVSVYVQNVGDEYNVSSIYVNFISNRLIDEIGRFIFVRENPKYREFTVKMNDDELKNLILYIMNEFCPLCYDKDIDKYKFVIEKRGKKREVQIIKSDTDEYVIKMIP